MCLSIHVSHCLEDFSPQTSPSGTIYPMVGVPSMCPPHQFAQFPTSGHPCRPAWCRQDNGPISELPTETKLMARACHYHCPEICYEFDMQKPSIPLWYQKEDKIMEF